MEGKRGGIVRKCPSGFPSYCIEKYEEFGRFIGNPNKSLYFHIVMINLKKENCIVESNVMLSANIHLCIISQPVELRIAVRGSQRDFNEVKWNKFLKSFFRKVDSREYIEASANASDFFFSLFLRAFNAFFKSFGSKQSCEFYLRNFLAFGNERENWISVFASSSKSLEGIVLLITHHYLIINVNVENCDKLKKN